MGEVCSPVHRQSLVLPSLGYLRVATLDPPLGLVRQFLDDLEHADFSDQKGGCLPLVIVSVEQRESIVPVFGHKSKGKADTGQVKRRGVGDCPGAILVGVEQGNAIALGSSGRPVRTKASGQASQSSGVCTALVTLQK